MLVILEREAGDFQFAAAFDVHAVEAVDENIGNGGILEQRFERAQTEDLVEDLARQLLALGETQRDGLAVHGTADEDENFFARRISGRAAKFFQVEAVEDLAMQVGFDLLVLAALEGL